MSGKIIIEKITESLDELMAKSNMRASDRVILNNISNADRKKEWLKTRNLIQSQFGQHVDYDSNGAPIVELGFVSISHTKNYVSIAYSETERCAIDMEHRSRDAARISHKFASAEEIAIAKLGLPINPELLIWCAKECLYKYAGIPGAEFKTDFKIISIHENCVATKAFSEEIELTFCLVDDMLMVYCPVDLKISK